MYIDKPLFEYNISITMKMKKVIKVLLGVAIAATIVVIAAFVLLHIVISYYTKPFEELLKAAETAIADVGGDAVLTAEAGAVLAHAKEKEKGSRAYTYTYLEQNDWEIYAPAMLKLQETLPQDVLSWIVLEPDKVILSQNVGEADMVWVEVPEHVVIRFGTHFSYAWMSIFAPDKTLSDVPDGVVPFGESIYFSPHGGLRGL